MLLEHVSRVQTQDVRLDGYLELVLWCLRMKEKVGDPKSPLQQRPSAKF